MAHTSADGNYEFKGLPDGAYRVLIPDTDLEENLGKVVLSGSAERYDFNLRRTEDFVEVEIVGLSGTLVDVEVHEWLEESRYVMPLELDCNGIGKLPASLIGYSLTFTLRHVGSRQVQRWDGSPLNLTLEEQPSAN